MSVFLGGAELPGGGCRPALRGLWPGLRGGAASLGFEDDPDELERIKRALRRARPELVLVGLGFRNRSA